MSQCFLNNVVSGAADNAVLNLLEKSIEVPSASDTKIDNRSQENYMGQQNKKSPVNLLPHSDPSNYIVYTNIEQMNVAMCYELKGD
jgi:hypothetical protein